MTTRGASWPTGESTALAPRLVVPATMLVYVVVLHQTYQHFIDPTFDYLGFTYRTPEPRHYTLIIALVIVLAACMPKILNGASSVLLWVHFIVATAPSMLVPLICPVLPLGTAFRFALGVAAVWAGVLFLMSERVRPRFQLSPHPTKASLWLTVLVMASLLVDMLVIAVGGVQLGVTGLFDVTAVRLSYRDALGAAPFGTAYVLLMVSNVVNPVLLNVGLRSRNWVLFAFAALGQLLVYGLTGYKMVILSIPAMIALHLWLRRREEAPARGFALASVGLMTVSYLAFALLGATALATLFVLRLVVAPGNVAAGYVAIFGDRDPVYWSYSFMGWLVDYPYSRSPNFMVGEIFRGSDDTSANVNIFGDGFMNMRWEGVAFEALVLVATLWFLDVATRDLPVGVAASAVLLPAFALSNSSIFTALTTHGLLVAVVVMMTMPREFRATTTAESPPPTRKRAGKK